MKKSFLRVVEIVLLQFIFSASAYATDYNIGPNQTFKAIGDIPWESLSAGDHVFIHWRTEAEGGSYKEKWVINIPGTEVEPFIVSGVLGSKGERPVIDGNGAVTRTELSYWGENRGVIKVGGSSVPDNEAPSFIVIENLEIRSAHPDYSFTDDEGKQVDYVKNAASLYIETGDNIIVRNCVFNDSGNGLFSSWASSNLLIEKNHIYGNGIVNSIFEHNSYTESTNIIFQYNRLGPLRDGAGGNNLKDRSAGLVIRYNWIEGGNRLMDLVDSEFSLFYDNPVYRKTFVYGNILIEEDGGNPQVIHYGGDSGNETFYRKGKLYFYNNTLYSVRNGNTTLIRLSSNDESADIRNNILFVTAGGNSLGLLDDTGNAVLRNNLIKFGWVNSHGGIISGTIDNDGSNIEGGTPGFVDTASFDFHLLENSSAINKGTNLLTDVLPDQDVILEYKTHQDSIGRAKNGVLDIGAYEFEGEVVTGRIDKTFQQSDFFQLYPNPVQNILHLSIDEVEIADGNVFTITGKNVFSFSKPTDNYINVSTLGIGVYLLKLNTMKGKIISKFIKE